MSPFFGEGEKVLCPAAVHRKAAGRARRPGQEGRGKPWPLIPPVA